MTTPFEPPAPPLRPAPARPGRKLGPIAEELSSAHCAWLGPLRETYLTSGLTLNELSARVRLAKSKISELLRGIGLYPRWEIIFSLSRELKMPYWPLHRLWRQAALEAHKSREWVERCTEKSAVTTSHAAPPLDHRAFRELVESFYGLYAQVFLEDDQRDTAVLSRLSQVVARLERKGYVHRRPDPADGRYTLANLTDEGYEKIVSVAPKHVAEVRRLVFDPLTKAQVKQLAHIGQRILRTVAPDHYDGNRG